MKKSATVTVICLLLTGNLNRLIAQCSFDPVIVGDTLLCGDEQSFLNTQVYDAYQWYYRYFGTDDPAQAITNAGSQTLEITPDLYLAYVSVEATLNACTERSPEVLIDLYTFLPVTVQSAGDYFINANGTICLCPGDTMMMIIQLPYTINIQWYGNGTAIPGAHNDTLVVTAPGLYQVEGSPEMCPTLLNHLENFIVVTTGSGPNCISGTSEPGKSATLAGSARFVPDLRAVDLRSEEPDVIQADLWHIQGSLLGTTKFKNQGRIPVGKLPAGMYFLHMHTGNRNAVFKIAIPGF